ncbi:PREDICTED: inactive beta-amylase 9 isoform X1 [Brassica oleracea var. oleracea]|uniref:Beta-amylase n=1 Tax=Brassica oleracea var. oleracea TaxID=109376 RepID=A0A0D3B1U5_BRAOL|nr:PREDICTED: inactive beta-amylase 9 isoform X1 [Brassica oleracea var. oleracea]
MEVSVIGNPQAKICRAELSFRELGFRLGSGESRNKVCFLTHQSSKWKEIRIRCSPRSVKCEAIVSDQAPFLKPTPNPRSQLESVKLFVGLPLDTVSDCNNVNHMKAITAGLKALKLLGVEGVELPVFWGVVEREAAGKYEWSGYLAVAEIVKKVGLKLQVSLSFHGSKDPEIGLPDWVAKIGEGEPGMYFTDRYGKQYKDCLSFGVDDVPVLDGKTPMEVYGGFCESFKSAFSDYMGNTITGITLGMGPAGELRYPSHQHETKPSGAGEFQCYDKHMLSALKHYAESSGNPLWGLGGPHDAPAYDQQPHSTSFFSDGGSWESQYGDFFLTWYSSLLTSHADRVLSVASSAFGGSGVSVSGKLPLLHQWNKLRSQPSELTAGFYSSNGHDRYEAIAEIFAKNSCRMIIPGMDLSDEHQSLASLSSPESLLGNIKTSCKKQGVVVSGQNSSASVPGGFERIVENLKDESVGIDLFTYQRMGALFFSPEHFHAFTVFVRNMNQVELSSYDQAGEDEAQTVSLGSGTGAHSLQTA